jgi:hypothetical protein
MCEMTCTSRRVSKRNGERASERSQRSTGGAEAPEWTKTLHKGNGVRANYHGLGRYAAEPRPLIRQHPEPDQSTHNPFQLHRAGPRLGSEPALHTLLWNPAVNFGNISTRSEPRPTNPALRSTLTPIRLQQAPQDGQVLTIFG